MDRGLVQGALAALSAALAFGSIGLTGATTAMPELGTWAMMIGGIGMAGGALRGRRTLLPATA